MMIRSRVLLIFLVAVAAFLPPSAWAWGCKGHEIVALIAENFLDPHAREMAMQTLAASPIRPDLRRYCGESGLDAFADSSTWADDERSVDRGTAGWHFIDIPLGVSDGDISKYCPTNGCVTSAIAAQLSVLKNSGAGAKDRADALRYVIHFIGDLHQPLHTTTNNDLGGNCMPVAFDGHAPEETNVESGAYRPNLHGVWDTGLIEQFSQAETAQQLATELENRFKPEIPAWESAPTDIDAWVWESHQIAQRIVYGSLPVTVPVEEPEEVKSCSADNRVSDRLFKLHEQLGSSYDTAADGAIQEQLTKAGVRLAAVLNSVWPGSLQASKASELKYVVIVSRHGVRSPTSSAQQLSQYSAEPWPQWDVPPGYLTSHGRSLMTLFGAYDRSYFLSQGLFRGQGCYDSSRVSYWADNEERTLETARAMAEGMLPGCDAKIGSHPKGEHDPLFSPLAAGSGTTGRALAAAAVSGRVGANPEALLDLYRTELDDLAQVLHGAKRSWLDAPMEITPGKSDSLADVTGPLKTASTLTENLLLEYTNGMTGKDLGWGRLDAATLQRIMVLHTAYADLVRRTSYEARAGGSNLLFHILASIRQAATGKSVSGALGNPGDAALVIVGHDTNLSNLSGILRISWLLQGYQADDPVPGGALVFELWQSADSKQLSVRTYYTAQSLEQMRMAVALTIQAPPLRAPVFIPGCGTASDGFDCDWIGFQRTVSEAIDPASVTQ